MEYINYLLLTVSVFFVCIQEFIKKSYLNNTEKSNDMLLNFFSVLGAIPLLFGVNAGGFAFHLPTVLCSIVYAAGYAFALIFTMKAYSAGTMGLTVIMISFSFVISVLFGALFLHEQMSIYAKIGILVLCAAVVLMNGDKNEEKEKKSISLKWLIYVLIAMLGNALCSIVVKLHVNEYSGKYSNELLMTGLFFVLCICFALLIINNKGNRTKILQSFKPTLIYGLLVGVANGLANYVTVKLNERMDMSRLAPVSKSGVFILTYFVSVFFYKEKMSKKQNIGFLLSLISIILLNL